MTQPFYASSATPEWYTPPWLVDRVVAMLEGVDLDPCSPTPSTVPAALHYTKEDDGLAREWGGKVFMNPPYGRVLPAWTRHLTAEYRAGRVTDAILLVAARVDTRWFRDVWAADALLFPLGRISFVREGTGEGVGSTFPSVLAYYGPSADRFREHFADLGTLVAGGCVVAGAA